MRTIITEIQRISSLMGKKSNELLIEEKEENRNEYYYDRIKGLLEFSGLYNDRIQDYLKEIYEYSKDQLIDFSLLERGVIKILKIRGDKSKNIDDFFRKLVKSLKKRQKQIFTTQAELDDEPSFEIQEPSVVPKKVYRK